MLKRSFPKWSSTSNLMVSTLRLHTSTFLDYAIVSFSLYIARHDYIFSASFISLYKIHSYAQHMHLCEAIRFIKCDWTYFRRFVEFLRRYRQGQQVSDARCGFSCWLELSLFQRWRSCFARHPFESANHVVKRFSLLLGILDQGTGMLVLRDEPYDGRDYNVALEIVHTLSSSLDLLFQKAKKLA